MSINKILSWSLCIAAVAFSHKAVADDSIMTEKIVTSQSVHDGFIDRTYQNPAARFFKNGYSLTSISFIGVADNTQEHKIAQSGKDNDYWSLNAQSQYFIDRDNIVWGKASYKRGIRAEVKWNETSDFNLLYPYVMADEKGGDLEYEQYYFDGGYAGRFNRWIVGASLCYRALDEYRTKDPRPNNIVADLKAQVGIGYVLSDYSLNIGLNAGKYKQTNDLKYFNDLGASKEYHLTGLGNEFVRFSGACNNVFYKGHNWGYSFEISPLRQKGLSLSLGYNRFSFDKILSSLNKLALNELTENKYIGEFAWMAHRDNECYLGIKADALYSEREGRDNLFGDASSNVYPKIGSALMYKNKIRYGRISGLYERTFNQCFPMGISPYAAYGTFKASHLGSGNTFESSSYILGALIQGCYIKGRHLFKISMDAAYRINKDSELNINKDGYCNESLFKSLANTAYYFSKDELNTRLSLRYQLQFCKKDFSCFIEASWMHNKYLEDKRADLLLLTTGINI